MELKRVATWNYSRSCQDTLSSANSNALSSERQRCIRDCSTFAIDGYLRDCSEEFDDIKNDIATVTDMASDNLETIDTLTPLVETNTANLATVTENVDDVNAVIGGVRTTWSDGETILDQLDALNERMNDVDSLLSRMDAVEARLDSIEERLFGYEPQTAEGENSDPSFTSPDEQSANSVPLVSVNGYDVDWVGFLVGITVLLLAVNVVCLVNNFCCGSKGKSSRKEYRVVYADSSDDMEKVERARLKK